MFEWLLDPCMTFVRKNCREYVSAGQANSVKSLMNLFDMLMDEAINKEDAAHNKHIRTYIQVRFSLLCSQIPSFGKKLMLLSFL